MQWVTGATNAVLLVLEKYQWLRPVFSPGSLLGARCADKADVGDSLPGR